MARVNGRVVRAEFVDVGAVLLEPAGDGFVGKRVLYRERLVGGEVRFEVAPLVGDDRRWRSERQFQADQPLRVA